MKYTSVLCLHLPKYFFEESSLHYFLFVVMENLERIVK